MLRKVAENSFDLVQKAYRETSDLKYLSGTPSSIDPSDIMPLIKAFHIVILNMNNTPFVMFRINTITDNPNESDIIKKWTVSSKPEVNEAYITLFKSSKVFKPYVGSYIRFMVMEYNPSSTTLHVTEDGGLQLVVLYNTQRISDNSIFNNTWYSVIMKNPFEKKKHHKSIYRYSKHILLLYNKRRILYA